MSALVVNLEPEVVELMHGPGGRVEDTLREYVVVELYRRRQISSGKAAELLGMERFEFVRYSSRLGIPFFDMDDHEMESEIAAARGTGGC